MAWDIFAATAGLELRAEQLAKTYLSAPIPRPTAATPTFAQIDTAAEAVTYARAAFHAVRAETVPLPIGPRKLALLEAVRLYVDAHRIASDPLAKSLPSYVDKAKAKIADANARVKAAPRPTSAPAPSQALIPAGSARPRQEDDDDAAEDAIGNDALTTDRNGSKPMPTLLKLAALGAGLFLLAGDSKGGGKRKGPSLAGLHRRKVDLDGLEDIDEGDLSGG